MDPLTAALLLGIEIIKLIRLNIESQPPELRAAEATRQAARLAKWEGLVDKAFDALLAGFGSKSALVDKKPPPG